MGVDARDVRPGKCFLSRGSKPQVVRVVSVRDGWVRFEARTHRGSWSGRTEAAEPDFISGLVREVGSDFRPI